MCGRFTLTLDTKQLRDAMPWLAIPEGLQPRFNIAPTQPVAVVPNDGKSRLDFFSWGLIPSWAKDPQIGSRLINARAETLAEKPSFRSAYRRRRCLILTDGFYEWKQVPGRKSKIPMYIRMQDGSPFAFAGLWENWQSPDGSEILSCTIITTQPNAAVQDIHNRMPVILPSENYGFWLTPDELAPQKLDPLLKPYTNAEMTAYPVSTLVNSPANESPECIVPATI
jgi:putative SOS response-associated peptidase YedK